MAESSQPEKLKLIKALRKHYKTDVMSGKSGFFIKGKGFITLAKARSVTGIKGKKRVLRPKTGGYGDYAIMRKIAGKM